MNSTVYDLTSADSKIIGFDFQYYYFISKLLELQEGEKIGYEKKEDVHIETNKALTLFQLKFSRQKAANGSPVNLTDLDDDLWKTVSHWADLILSCTDNNAKLGFLKRTNFVLATNKSVDSNTFFKYLDPEDETKDITQISNYLKELNTKTTNGEIQNYLQNILSLPITV